MIINADQGGGRRPACKCLFQIGLIIRRGGFGCQHAVYKGTLPGDAVTFFDGESQLLHALEIPSETFIRKLIFDLIGEEADPAVPQPVEMLNGKRTVSIVVQRDKIRFQRRRLVLDSDMGQGTDVFLPETVIRASVEDDAADITGRQSWRRRPVHADLSKE